MNHAEGFKEGVDDVDDQQKEGGGRQEREDDGAKAGPEARTVDGCGFDHGFRDRLEPCEEEQEVVADATPC